MQSDEERDQAVARGLVLGARVLAAVLVTVGVALWSVAAALVVAGIAIAVIATMVDVT